MGKQIVVQIVDDLDGAVLDKHETVKWSLDDKHYEFDTSPINATADVAISATALIAEANTRISLAPNQSYQDRQEAQQATEKIVLPPTE